MQAVFFDQVFLPAAVRRMRGARGIGLLNEHILFGNAGFLRREEADFAVVLKDDPAVFVLPENLLRKGGMRQQEHQQRQQREKPFHDHMTSENGKGIG